MKKHATFVSKGTVEGGEEKDFVHRVTLGKILNQQNLELLYIGTTLNQLKLDLL